MVGGCGAGSGQPHWAVMCALLLVTNGLSCHCPHSNKEQWGNPWGSGHGCQWQQPGDHWMGQEGRKTARPVGGKEARCPPGSRCCTPGASQALVGFVCCTKHLLPQLGLQPALVGRREPETDKGAGAVCRYHTA